MTNIPNVTPSQIFETMDYFAETGTSPLFWGAVGIGKSAIIRQWCEAQAEKLGLEFCEIKHGVDVFDPKNTFGFIDLRVVLLDALDVKGAPKLDDIEGLTKFLSPSILPHIARHGHAGFLFLDEVAQGYQMVVNALSQLVLDKKVGDSYSFPAGWTIGAASNRKEDQASTSKIGAHMLNRFAHLNVEPDVKDFTSYLASQGTDGRMAAFLRLCPDLVHNYKKGDVAFPTPRSIVSANNVLQSVDDRDLRETLISSFVGTGFASMLEGFLAMAAQLTTWNQIRENPLTAKIPEAGADQSVAAMWALCGMVCNRVDAETIGQAVAYIERLPEDFQVSFFLDLSIKKADLMDTATVSKWRATHHAIAV